VRNYKRTQQSQQDRATPPINQSINQSFIRLLLTWLS